MASGKQVAEQNYQTFLDWKARTDDRIILYVSKSKLLDRTLIYKAITRAQRKVNLVGDEDMARKAVIELPRADHCQVVLGLLLNRMLSIKIEVA